MKIIKSNSRFMYHLAISCAFVSMSQPVFMKHHLCLSYEGDLVVQGDVPVAKFRVSNSAIYYLFGVEKFKNLLPLRVVKIDMTHS